jgi:hypothetical protein
MPDQTHVKSISNGTDVSQKRPNVEIKDFKAEGNKPKGKILINSSN